MNTSSIPRKSLPLAALAGLLALSGSAEACYYNCSAPAPSAASTTSTVTTDNAPNSAEEQLGLTYQGPPKNFFERIELGDDIDDLEDQSVNHLIDIFFGDDNRTGPTDEERERQHQRELEQIRHFEERQREADRRWREAHNRMTQGPGQGQTERNRTGPTDEERERQHQRELEQIRHFEDKLERQNRLALEDARLISDLRNRTAAASRAFVEKAEADGKWTPEEEAEYDRLADQENEAWVFTPEERVEMDRQNAVRTQVIDELRRSAFNMGGISDADIAERAQTAKVWDAGTKTWRNATFTGRMLNEVGNDITAQRELGIKANNMMMAATNYMNRTDITAEQRAAAQQAYDAAHFARGAAADAIGKDTALILAGTASDVVVLGAGRGAAIVGGKAAEAAGALWGKLFGGAAAEGGAEAGAAAGSAAGSKAGQAGAGAQAGRTTGTEAGTAGKAAGEEAGAAGTSKAPSQMSQAERQAYNDAKAQQAASEGWRSGRAMEDGGEHMLPTPSGAVMQPAVGELSKDLTQAEVNALFKPGANLTAEQIGQKADLLLTGYRPPVIGAPGLPPSGVVAGVADNSATVILSGQEAASGIAAEAGTVITKPGAAATGSTTQAFPGTLPLPNTAPGTVTGAAAETGTVITRPGAAAATGGTTQAFPGTLSLPSSSAAAAGRVHESLNTTDAANSIVPTLR